MDMHYFAACTRASYSLSARDVGERGVRVPRVGGGLLASGGALCERSSYVVDGAMLWGETCCSGGTGLLLLLLLILSGPCRFSAK